MSVNPVATPPPNPPPGSHRPVPDPEHVNIHDLPRIPTWAVGLLALAAVACFGGLFLMGYLPYRQRQAELLAEARRVESDLPIVQVTHPQVEPPVTEFTLPADVRPQKETTIFSRTSGYIKKLYVDIGERVAAGQLLAEIDSPEVDAQLGKARAAVEQAKADAMKAQADRDLAQSTFDRFAAFAKQGGVTKQQLDEKHSALSQADASLAAARANILAAQAEVDRLARLQGFEKITAPFAGIITYRRLDIGTLLPADNTDPGKELFRIAQTDPLRVFVDVPQVYVGFVRNNSDAMVEVRNFPGRQFKGHVLRSTGEVDAATRTLKFLVLLPNPDNMLFPGMYAQVKFLVHETTPTLTVFSGSLLYTPTGVKVGVVHGNRVTFTPIKLGRDLGTRLEVLEGLHREDAIVANPGERLTDGAEVRIVSGNDNSDQPAPPEARAR